MGTRGDYLNQFNMDILRTSQYGSVTTNYNTSTSTSESTGQVIGNIMTMALGIGGAYLMNKAEAGAGTPSNKQISKGVAELVNQLPQKIASSVSSFNTKYGIAGITIDANGTLSKAYDQMKSDLETQIKTKKNEVLKDKDSGTVKANYENYSNLKTTVSNLESVQTSYNSYNSQIKSHPAEHITITNDTANANDLTEDEIKQCKQALGGDWEKDTSENYKNTNLYQQFIARNKAQADSYNSLIKSRNDLFQGLDYNGTQITADNLADKINQAKQELEELGKQKIEGTSSTCAQHDAALKSLENRLAALGTKAEFDAAVKEIKNMNTMLSDALKVQSEEKDVTEASNRVKANKKGGTWLNRIFGKKSDANKAARADKKRETQERNDAYAQFMEKYFS